MNTENFAGKNGFIWWVGELENRVDPLAIGRCQVRIFGWHSINKQLVPTEDLPWAHPMYPLNNSKSFAAPRVGDWIVGFFLDGENAQQPVMMGVLPGVASAKPPVSPPITTASSEKTFTTLTKSGESLVSGTITNTTVSGTLTLGKPNGPITFNGQTVNPSDAGYAAASAALIQKQSDLKASRLESRNEEIAARNGTLS
jgi:hypothetical protein